MAKSATRMTITKQYDYLNRLTNIMTATNGAVVFSSRYGYNSANQRTNVVQADGSAWVYQYDPLGQLTSGKKYWGNGTPVAGQQAEYVFDEIGNRKTVSEGGNASGTGLRQSVYTANLLNQYSQRTIPNTVDILGYASQSATSLPAQTHSTSRYIQRK
jgi:YD repeat-containing protein